MTLISMFAFLSCGNIENDTFDFSESLPNYVEFQSVKALSIKQGAKANFTISTKSSYFKDVAVTVKMDGQGLSETKTITLPKMKTNVTGDFTVPEATAVGTEFEITITSAKSDTGEIRLGRIDNKTTVIKGKVIAK